MSIKLVDYNGKKYWRVYLCERAKLPNGKVKKIQKALLFDLKNKAIALKEKKKWKQKLIKQACLLEGSDLEFGYILGRFEVFMLSRTIGQKMNLQTAKGHISLIRRYCKCWESRIASELTRGDGREILTLAEVDGASPTQLRKIKTAINLIYNWGIEEKLIRGVPTTPVQGLQIGDERGERVPEILTLDQVQKLLFHAKKSGHPWYPVWAFAFLTGMRSGELYALKWSSVDFVQRVIRVIESYAWADRRDKCTKSGYWRLVPISHHLLEVLHFLKDLTGDDRHVLPRLPGWENGEAGKHLRLFLKKIGISDPVVFHTLRACFATHLLASGVEPVKVMAIGGWKDLKTFGLYIRLSGVSVLGVTEPLNPYLSSERQKQISVVSSESFSS